MPLLLLDSDVEGNADALRAVTDRLYGGGSEHRLHQELLLGVGGVRALRVYSRLTGAPAPEVFHTNEGHAGFLGLERIRELTSAEGAGLDFDTAAGVGPRRHRLHHPHAGAGRDRQVRRELIEQYFGENGPTAGVPLENGSWRSAPRTTRAATRASSTWP